MSGSLVLAIDQGTSSTKALLVDSRGEIVGRAQTPVSLATPEPGWVQQDGEEIWSSVRRAASEAIDADAAKRVVSVGLSTQRESCIIWDRRTGEALTPVLSWQDQRTEGTCAALRAAGHGATIRRRSGLPLDPMFSAAKAHWLLDRLPQGRARAKAGQICIGTIDAFLLSRFGGEAVVEAGNASRTQLFDVVGAKWDEELLSIFDVPVNALPRVVASRGPFPKARALRPLRDGTPVGAVLADSHSALFAHGAFGPGPVKATQGTGSSIMGLVDRSAARDGDAGAPGVCLTLAWQLDAPMLAYEGNIRSAGSTLIWAAELLGVSTKELAELAASAPDSARRVFRPGFRGSRRALVGRQRLRDSHRLFLWRHARTLCARRARLDRSPDRRRGGRIPVERRARRAANGRRRPDPQQPAHAVRGGHGGPARRADSGRGTVGAGRRPSRRRQRRPLHAGEFSKLDRGAERFAPRMDAAVRADERRRWAHAVARARALPIPLET